MQEGLLWFDANPKRDIADKVARAADRYRVKFGRRPNLCYVHESVLDSGTVEFNGVRLVPVNDGDTGDCAVSPAFDMLA